MARACADEDGLEAAEVVAPDIRQVAQHDEHRRHTGEEGGPVFLDRPGDLSSVEARQQDDLAAGQQRGVHGGLGCECTLPFQRLTHGSNGITVEHYVKALDHVFGQARQLVLVGNGQ